LIIKKTIKSPTRWDTVAQECYGDASLMNDLLDANPDVAITEVIPAGTVLQIPVLAETSNTTATDKMPPWKQ
jgi:phage tail protein X